MSAPAPDPTPDLVTAVYREIEPLAGPLRAAGVGPPPESDSPFSLWLWPYEPRDTVNGLAVCSVVIRHGRPWASANRYNTLRMPSIAVDIYADIDRDVRLGPAFRSAQRKALDVWAIVDGVLHRPGGGDHRLGNVDGTIRAVSMVRSSGEPSLDPVPDTDGVWVATCTYAVELG